MATFKLDILTPFGKYYSGDAEYLSIRNSDGVLGILPHHTPLITTVNLCKVVVVIKGNRHAYATTGGLLHVKSDNSISLMVNTIERSDEIDVERAKRAFERAKRRIQENKEKLNLKRAEDALARAENRLEVAKDKDNK